MEAFSPGPNPSRQSHSTHVGEEIFLNTHTVEVKGQIKVKKIK